MVFRLVLLALLGISSHPKAFVGGSQSPVLDISEGASYVGSLPEGGDLVDLSPALRIKQDTGPVCSYILSFADDVSVDVPFHAEIQDRVTGRAVLRPSRTVSCKDTRDFRLKITPKSCDDETAGKSIDVRIKLSDTVNDHAPEFLQPWYEATIDEDKLYDNIVKVQASDSDCSKKFSEICSYEITNQAAPFSIDSSGVVRNVRPLSYDVSHSYILTVVAVDCGQLRSQQEAIVTINIRRKCDVGFTNMPSSISYVPGNKHNDSPISVFPQLGVELCEDMLGCDKQEWANATVKLTHDLRNGCDKAQSDDCKMNPSTVSLLPERGMKEPVGDAEIDGVPSTDETYEFDGASNAIIVESETIGPLPPRVFTLSFSMNHVRQEDSVHKENIVCSADAAEHNRHHFAVYIRHCKLEFLKRVEYTPKTDGRFFPSEWRWHTPEVCDGKWHRYVITANGPDDVHLYVDGRLAAETENQLEILDDWPLHKSHAEGEKLTVGACWHGKDQRMAQYFTGSLANVFMLYDAVEPHEVLQCHQRCGEVLDYTNGLIHMRPGMESSFSTDLSELSLRAPTVEDLASMLRYVGYVNSVEAPTVGKRDLTVEGNVKCAGIATTAHLAPSHATLYVEDMKQSSSNNVKSFEDKRASTVAIEVNPVLHASVEEVSAGIHIFEDITIEEKNEGSHVVLEDAKLESCRISSVPPFDKAYEYFSSPATVISQLGLDFEQKDAVLLLSGPQHAAAYATVLRQLHYFNTAGHAGDTRRFSVECTGHGEEKGTPATVELIITHVDEPVAVPVPTEDVSRNEVPQAVPQVQPEPAARKIDQPEFPMVPPALETVESAEMARGASTAGSIVAVIVVVCIGFLLALVIVGVLKLRQSHVYRRKHSHGGGDLAWDDDGLNITVNPLEDMETQPSSSAVQMDDGASDSDCGESFGCSSDSENEEDELVLPRHTQGARLQWEDTVGGGPVDGRGRGRMLDRASYRV